MWTTEKVQFGIGSDLTFYSKPSILDPLYGTNPVSWKLFFRIRPGKMDMSMHGMHGTSRNMNPKPCRVPGSVEFRPAIVRNYAISFAAAQKPVEMLRNKGCRTGQLDKNQC